jgi:hypothetical protein
MLANDREKRIFARLFGSKKNKQEIVIQKNDSKSSKTARPTKKTKTSKMTRKELPWQT